MTLSIKWSLSKMTMGITLLAVHISTIAMLLLFGSRAFPSFDDMISSVLILTPLTVSYVTAFLKDVVKNQFVSDVGEDVQITIGSFVVQMTFVAIFSIALWYIVASYIFVGGWNVNQFKTIMGVVESAFGVFVGIIVTANYGDQKRDAAPGR